jgi:hypothetical protein
MSRKYPNDNDVIEAYLEAQKLKRWESYKAKLVENIMHSREMERSRVSNFGALIGRSQDNTRTIFFKHPSLTSGTPKPAWKN